MPHAKRYVAQCYGGGEHADRPALAVFDIDQALAAWIVRMARLVRSNDLVQVEQWNCTPTWLEYDPREESEGDCGTTPVEALSWPDTAVARTECGRIAVTADTYLFLCCRKNGDLTFETAEQEIAGLAQHFGIPFDAGPPEPAEPAAEPAGVPTVRAVVARHSVDHVEVEVEADDPRDEDAIVEAALEAACHAETGFANVSTQWTFERVLAPS